jgi:drug/metabolite transporter (DMT)-like permease
VVLLESIYLVGGNRLLCRVYDAFGLNMIIAGFYTLLFALPGQATPPEHLFNLHDWLMVWATLCLLLLFATSVSGLLWSIQTELRR